jgi:hypothetical protein
MELAINNWAHSDTELDSIIATQINILINFT